MARALPIPADFAAHALLPNAELMARYGISNRLVANWRKSLGIEAPHGGSPRRSIPDGLAEIAPRMMVEELARHFKLHKSTIRRMLLDLGVEAIPNDRNRIVAPLDLAERAAEFTMHGLSRHYGTTHKVATRWCKEAGLTPLARPLKVPKPPKVMPVKAKRLVSAPAKLPPAAPAAPVHDGSRAARAAEYLRRRDAVFRCGENGKPDPKGAYWFTCSRIFTPEQLVERAEGRGWQPDAWRQVVAA